MVATTRRDRTGEGSLRAFRLGDWIERVAAGERGGAALDPEAARWLMSMLLSGRLRELECGAALSAWRVKGLEPDELVGAVAAARSGAREIELEHGRPLVVIPAYRRLEGRPDPTPLLACLLADAGVQVLVHGERNLPESGACAEVFAALGIPVCTRPGDAGLTISRGDPAFVPLDVISPALDALCSLRWRLGGANVGHAVARVLVPTSHPDPLVACGFAGESMHALLRGYFERAAVGALLLPEAELGGETPSPELFAPVRFDGRPPAGMQEGRGVSACARWIQSVLAGERPVPAGIDSLVRQVLASLGSSRRAAANR